jgi:hypothetical protein
MYSYSTRLIFYSVFLLVSCKDSGKGQYKESYLCEPLDSSFYYCKSYDKYGSVRNMSIFSKADSSSVNLIFKEKSIIIVDK